MGYMNDLIQMSMRHVLNTAVIAVAATVVAAMKCSLERRSYCILQVTIQHQCIKDGLPHTDLAQVRFGEKVTSRSHVWQGCGHLPFC